MARVFDMHVHTTRSGDSMVTLQDIVDKAQRVGLNGICLTEHGWRWDRRELAELADGTDLVLIRSIEIPTDFGHIITFGWDDYQPGWDRTRDGVLASAHDLCRSVRLAGGYTVGLHPFRYAFEGPKRNHPTLETAESMPLLQAVDAIEVMNGSNSPLENLFALAVARRLGRPATAGSDAHSPVFLGTFVTVFDNDIQDEADFLRELKADRFHIARGFYNGKLEPCAMTDEDIAAGLRSCDVI